MCPGQTYTLQVDTGSDGHAILTASQGSLSMSSDTCEGRAVFDPNYNSKVSSTSAAWSTDLTLPCTATGEVALAMTYAASDNDNFHQNSATFTVDTTCSATSCSSPTTTTTTTPTTTPTTTTTTPSAPTTTTTTTPSTPTTTTPTTTTTSGGGDDDDDDDEGHEGHDDDERGDHEGGNLEGRGGSPSTADTTTTGTNATAVTGTSTRTTPSSTSATTTTAATSGSVTAFTAPMCKQPIQTSNATCAKSALGYACSSTLNGLTLHYTVGGCPPSNPCTASYALRNPSASAAQAYLHMAASYPTTGYISIGFARNPGSMPGTDAVIGWVMDDGTPRINSYYIPGTSVSSNNMYANADQWMVMAGAVQEGGITTICFSRPLDAAASKVAPQLLKSSGLVGMNWAYTGNGRKALVQHSAAGGFTFNPALGGSVVTTSGTNFMLIHGVLMGVAWIELIPLGVLMARHKKLMGERKLCGIHVWFHLHRVVQMVAVAVFAGGLALAYTKLEEPQGGLGKAHGILAYVLIALVGLQVVVSFLRPKPTEALRKYWNLLHWNIGRLAAAVGIANTYIGVKVYKRERLENVTVWYIVISVILGVYLVGDVLLSLWGRKAEKAAARQQLEMQQQQVAANKGLGVPVPADVEYALQRLP